MMLRTYLVHADFLVLPRQHAASLTESDVINGSSILSTYINENNVNNSAPGDIDNAALGMLGMPDEHLDEQSKMDVMVTRQKRCQDMWQNHEYLSVIKYQAISDEFFLKTIR